MNPLEEKPKVVPEEEREVVVNPAQGVATPVADDGETILLPREAAVLPVRNMVIYPGTVMPLQIGREKSRKLLSSVLPGQKVIVTVCQRNPQVDDPGPNDLFGVGSAVIVLKLLKMEDENQSVIVHGRMRVAIEEFTRTEPYLTARVRVLHDVVQQGTELDALVMNARTAARRVIQLSPNIAEEASVVLNNIDQPGMLADFLASNLPMDVGAKQRMLEELNVVARLRAIITELGRQLEVLELGNKIQSQVRENIDKSQREYFLQEQLKAIQKELGQADEKSVEVEEVRKKIDAAGMPEHVKQECLRELGRMERMPTVSPEYYVLRTYLDVISELPWSKSTPDKIDVNLSKKILDEDHYDLEKVKRRILEFLAVREAGPRHARADPVLRGPAGRGQDLAGPVDRPRDGPQVHPHEPGRHARRGGSRGHRRTYIGAMPGRVVQEIRKAGTNNPVFMLDELDKVGADFRGDPTSALLEILDPAQNNSFQDHYLNVPFDLSKVLFIGTANYMAPVPPALRDRMEVIELPGYTRNEKLQIAVKYLVPRQLKENGLTAEQCRWEEEAIGKIIDGHTREAGVRELERQIGTVCRAVAAQVAAGKIQRRAITPQVVARVLGPRRYESELALRTSVPGVATGLAYTPFGGEIIFVEATSYPGKGNLVLTGQIGDVMRESAHAALSLIKSRASQLGIDGRELLHTDIHIHVPAGAVPKDGPSAGVAMATALASLLMNRPARAEVAMTGEITLRGLVLPIGGVKEKVIAAKAAGIKTVVLPERNRKDLLEVPKDARKGLNFVFAKTIEQVMKAALDRQLKGTSAKDTVRSQHERLAAKRANSR